MALAAKEHRHGSNRWGYLRGLFEDIGPRDAALLAGLALFQAFGYLLFESSTVLSSLGALSPAAQSQFLTFALVGRTATYAPAFVAWGLCKRQPTPVHLALTAGVSAAGGFTVLHLAAQLAVYAPSGMTLPWLAVAGLLLSGGGALTNLVWARVACTLHDLRRIYLFAPLSNLVSLLVYLVAVRMPTGAVSAVDAAPFCASLVLGTLWLHRREAAAPHRQPTEASGDSPSSPPADAHGTAPGFAWKPLVSLLWRPTLGTAILYFMGGLMLQMPHNQELSLAQFQETALLTQAVFMGALLPPVLLIRNQPSLGALFKVALPLSAAGFVLLPPVWSGGIANVCAQPGSGVASIILWCMVANAAREHWIPATPLFACTLCATGVAQLAGTVAGVVFQGSLDQGDVALTGVALLAVYLVAMVSPFLFKDRTLGGAQDPAQPAPRAPSTDAELAHLGTRCQALAQTHGLTPRETELLVQLAQGRTLRAISEKPTVSENTVKYHVKSIYQKLGVHARDEIIDPVKED